MSHSALATGLVSPPHALVFGAVGPELHSDAISLASLLIVLALVEAALSHIFEFIDEYARHLRVITLFLLP
jgi:hypothetical protein